MTEEELKNISIRGVNADVYEAFSNKIKTLELNIGEAITKIMEGVINDFDETFPQVSAANLKAIAAMNKGSIQHQRQLDISRTDLVETEMRFYFQHIDTLTFGPDIDQDTFEKYVLQIQHCHLVRLPSTMSKLRALATIQHCDDVEFYEVDG